MLAPDQTLRWSMVDDVEFLDPAHVSAAMDIGYVQEVFSGLYRFNNNNKLVPDLATGMPDVSADGGLGTGPLASRQAGGWTGHLLAEGVCSRVWDTLGWEPGRVPQGGAAPD
jgi:ABC-type transport system substrate-binding protein